MNIEHIKNSVRNVPDFPEPGIQFKDITPILHNPKVFNDVMKIFYDRYKNKNINVVVGIESRGFIFGVPLALNLNCAFVPSRKKGKLPSETVTVDYELEYGTNSLEIHKDSIQPDDNVLILDDLLATGGTIEAAIDLVTQLQGNIIEVAFLIELIDLNNKEKLGTVNKFSILKL